MEKDRARQELRALLAGPAAGFAALSGDEFFAALKQACQDGTANPALIADCERRITSGEVGPRELRQVLFAASDRHAWAGVRALALAAAGQVPGTAVAVVGLEAQRLGVAPMQVTESAADGGFTATASLERDGARVEGKAGYGGSKKTARQAAALSLLAALTGVAVPADDDPPAAPRGFPDDPGLRPADLESWLDYEVARPSPDPELARDRRPSRQADRVFGVPSAVRGRSARVSRRSRCRMGGACQRPLDGRGSAVHVQPGAGLAHGPVHPGW